MHVRRRVGQLEDVAAPELQAGERLRQPIGAAARPGAFRTETTISGRRYRRCPFAEPWPQPATACDHAAAAEPAAASAVRSTASGIHDCARARESEYLGGPLAAGQVLTVEPGLYFQANDELIPPAHYEAVAKIIGFILAAGRRVAALAL